jgi:hypothetical protein
MNKENLLSKISKMSEEELRDLACNTPDVEILNILAENENCEVRCVVAANEYTSADMFAMLAKDEDWSVREQVALNESTPADVLTLLAKDENGNVREAVAGNNNTSVETLTILASDKEWWVRYAIARNENTPVEALVVLAKDDELNVLCTVADSPKANDTIFQDLLCCDDLLLLEHIVLNPAASNNILNTIADSVGDAYIEGIVKGRTSERNRAKEALEMIFSNVDMTNIPYEALDFIVENNLVPDSMKDDDLYVLFKKDSKIKERAER